MGLIQTWEPRLAATHDGHFVVAWSQRLEEPTGLVGDVYTMVLDAGGLTIQGPTKFTDDAIGGEFFGSPALAPLQGDRVLLAHAVPGGVTYAIFDSAGGLLHQGPVIPVPVAPVAGSGIDAAEMADGTILLAWTDGPNYVLIDGATYDLLAGPVSLNSPAGLLSATSAPAGHGILTWRGLYNGATNLYYALIDSAGDVVVEPMVFRSRPSGFGLGNTGSNNAPYTVEPTAPGVDMSVTSPALAAGPPGGVAPIPIQLENAGASPAHSVIITATLGSGLNYLRDTSGITPTIIGSTLAWNLPDLAFLGNGTFNLFVQLPDVPVGLQFPVMLEIAAAEPDANPADNQAAVSVMVAHQRFFPVLLD